MLENKIAIVTGASGGLGAGIALGLAREGAKVAIVVNNNMASGEALAQKMVEEKLPQPIVLKAQVADKAQVDEMVRRVVEKWGTVHILMNNAGVTSPQRLSTIDEAEWDRVMNINAKGTLYCSQAVIPYMKQQKWGRIINMGSLTGKNGGFISGGVYIASKGAIHSFTFALAKELAPYNITVNAVAPGPISTDMIAKMPPEKVSAMLDFIPLHRLGTPMEVAGAVNFLASDSAAFITGEVIDINGGAYTD